jgi:agmatinase
MPRPSPHPDLDGVGTTTPMVSFPPQSFFGAPICTRLSDFNAEVALLGVPYDQGSLIPYCRVGQSQGPRAVRMNPTFFYGGNPFDGPPDADKPCMGFHCVDDGKEYLVGVTMMDIGDVSIPPGDLKRFISTTTEVARTVASRRAVLVGVGGDHSITFPLVRGMEPWGEVDIVHFDAHYDIRDEVMGSRYSHSSPISRSAELPFVNNITQLGMRNIAAKTSLEMVAKLGTTVIPAARVHREGAAECIEKYVPRAKNIYVTVDTDAFDWTIAPGTVLPEPGGITLQQFRDSMQVIVQKGNVVGLDITCLNPLVDTNWYGGITIRLVSYVMAYGLGYIFDARA